LDRATWAEVFIWFVAKDMTVVDREELKLLLKVYSNIRLVEPASFENPSVQKGSQELR
jgi:hypothetical protein